MNQYELHYIRHVVGKALEDDDLFDPEALEYEEIETALWSAAGDVANGLVITHPDDLDVYDGFDPETNAFPTEEDDE